MSHCISVFLIKKSDLRSDKIDSVVENSSQQKIKWTELGEGILATTNIPNIKEFGKDKMIAKIETDYFGGAGEQSAVLFDSNKKIYNNEDDFTPINEVLKIMGIERKNGQDQFDLVGLGRYRSNSDFK
jgi:hypothetical protein